MPGSVSTVSYSSFQQKYCCSLSLRPPSLHPSVGRAKWTRAFIFYYCITNQRNRNITRHTVQQARSPGGSTGPHAWGLTGTSPGLAGRALLCSSGQESTARPIQFIGRIRFLATIGFSSPAVSQGGARLSPDRPPTSLDGGGSPSSSRPATTY